MAKESTDHVFDIEPAKKHGQEKVKAQETYDTMKLFKCRVMRVNIEKENQDLPIHVHSNDRYGNRPKQFFPNQEVLLTESEMDVLRNSAQEDYIEIPSTSGIYKTLNPLVAAESEFPGWKASWGRRGVVVEKRTPNYAIDVTDVVKIPAAGIVSANVGRAILEGGDPDFVINQRAVDKMAS